MSTNSSILDDFLIDTTRLSLIRRYKPPFELDKLVLSAEKRQAVLEVMRQQRSAAKDAQANQGASSSSDDKMDVEPTDPPKALAESDESKMDVDEPNVSVKEETATGSKNADSGADERSSLSRKYSDLEEEKKQKLIRLAELDKKVKEAQTKIESLEEEKGGLFVQLKQVLAVESKSRQEEQRLMQQRAEEARLAMLAQQQQLQQQQEMQAAAAAQAQLHAHPPQTQGTSQPSPYPPQHIPHASSYQPAAVAPSASPAAPSPASRPRSPDRSFTSPRGGYDRDYNKRDDEPRQYRGNDRYNNDRPNNDSFRDRDNYNRGVAGRDKFNNSDGDRDRFGGSGGGGGSYGGNNRFQGGYNNDRDRFDQRDNNRDYRGGYNGPKRDFNRDNNRDFDRDARDNRSFPGGDRDRDRDRFNNDRDREPDRDRDRDRDWNRRYERDGYNSRPLSSPPPAAASYPPPPPRPAPLQPPPPTIPAPHEQQHPMPHMMYPPPYGMPPQQQFPPPPPPYGVPQDYGNPAYR